MKINIFVLLMFFFNISNLIGEQLLIESSISLNTAVIEIQTDTECYSRLMFGEKENKLSNILLQTDMTKKHRYEISNLSEGTKYFYKIEYYTDVFKQSSGIGNFVTLGIPSPFINEMKVISDIRKIKFLVKTNIPIKYEIEINNIKLIDSEYKTEIDFDIDNLKPGTEYLYSLRIYNEKNVEHTETGKVRTRDNNMALYKKTEGTFNINPEEKFIKNEPPIIDRITDGKLNYFTGLATSGNIKTDNQSIIIDLEQDTEIEKIKVYWRGLAYSKNYLIMLSKDKKKWELAEKNIDALKGIQMLSESGDPVFMNEISINKSGRYVRLWIPQNSDFYCKHNHWNYVQIFEIEIINNKF
ncbi:discoidin domain-containing protein [Candidatus Dependentiae bacterium]|nr:discoidin domain-containing protein [Candidatus Dependentiae bacterium]